MSTRKEEENVTETLSNSYTRSVGHFQLENERKIMCGSPHNIIKRIGHQRLKGNHKVDCPLWNGETLQGPCLTVTQEKLDGCIDRMNKKKCDIKKCDS